VRIRVIRAIRAIRAIRVPFFLMNTISSTKTTMFITQPHPYPAVTDNLEKWLFWRTQKITYSMIENNDLR
jgi:hypothetical protein